MVRQPTQPPFGATISSLPIESADRPQLRDLAAALREVQPFLQAAESARGAAYVNHEGGDVGAHSTQRSLYRHVANYLAAAELAEASGARGSVLDVGSGTGALAAWVATRAAAELHLVDRDAAVRRVARAAFPTAHVHAELDEVPRATVGVVTAMEVIEHVAPADQPGFVTALLSRVEPGGVLVVSTPDESGYLGGWSGYAPHIGPLTAQRLEELLTAAAPAGARVTVWRMQGDAFHLGGIRRVIHPVANRLWTRLEPLVAPITHRLVGPAAKLADLARTHAGPEMAPEVSVVAASQGTGTGLLGVVRIPA